MQRIQRLLLVTLLAASAASSQQLQVTSPAGQTTDGRTKWKFTITITGVPPNGRFELRLELPELITTPVITGIPDGLTLVAQTRHGAFREWTFQSVNGGNGEFQIEMNGLSDLVRNGNVRWVGKVDGQDAGLGTVDGPELVYQPALVRPVFGGGLSFRFDDVVDFKDINPSIDEQVLIDNDSRMRAAAIVGVLFKLRETNGFMGLGSSERKRALDLIVSLEFAQGTQHTLDGFLFGLGFAINDYVELAFGYSLRKGRELSVGFRREAARMVAELRDDGMYASQFRQFELTADGKSFKDVRQFDGFPLVNPKTNVRFFTGNPSIDSYNSTFHVGVIVPVDFKKLFNLGTDH